MGLDMYLNGNAYFHGLTDDQLKTQPTEQIFRLGYWRKHPDLHGYIVQQFTNGEDNCQEIELAVGDMFDIINAIQNDRLPKTAGFFFGESANDAEQKAQAIEIFGNAIDWLLVDDKNTWRSVHYRASW